MASMTAENRYEFLQAQRCRIEWLQSGPNKGTCRLFIGNGKTPYLGRTLNQAIDLAHSFVEAQVPAMAGSGRTVGTKTGTRTRKTAVAAN